MIGVDIKNKKIDAWKFDEFNLDDGDHSHPEVNK